MFCNSLMAILLKTGTFFLLSKVSGSTCDKKLMKINQKAELPLQNLSLCGNGWLYKCA